MRKFGLFNIVFANFFIFSLFANDTGNIGNHKTNQEGIHIENLYFAKTIGIIGGAGPMASAYLYQIIINICQKNYSSVDYSEFPQIILISYPFIRGNPEKTREDLTSCLTKLKNANASVIGLACNSLHAYLPDLSGVEFIHLVNQSVQTIHDQGISKVLVLSAQKTIDSKLYEQEGLSCIYPIETNQMEINRIIREVASGIVCNEQTNTLNRIISNAEPIEGIILACTELPLVHHAFPLSTDLPIIDTIEVLARKLVEAAK